MRPGCRPFSQRGTSLLELTVAMAMAAILAAVGTAQLDTGPAQLTAAHQEIRGSLDQAFNLAPGLQERVLFSSPDTGRLIFPDLVAIVRIPLWANQRVAWDQILKAKGAGPKRHSGGKQGTSNVDRPNPAPKESENGRTQVSKGGPVLLLGNSAFSAKNPAP